MRLRGVLGCLLLSLLGSALLPAQVEWPFGGTRRSLESEELDLWNLGLLGAKAKEPGATVQRSATTGRRRTESSGDAPKSDDGPAQLEVVLLFPQGPAAKAGLLAGDVITGVNGQEFRAGSLPALAQALMTAESREKGSVILEVRRTTAKGVEARSIKVPVPTLGPAALHPELGAARKEIQKAALSWLAEAQSGDGGYPETLSGRNGSVVQASLAGLAFLAAADATGRSPWSAQVDKAVKFTLRHALAPDEKPRAGGANWDQTNWGLLHSILFLSEVMERRRSALPRSELDRLVTALQQRMELSGGYAHGPGGKNALDYLELNIVGSLVLTALGSAQRVGAKVDLDRAKALFAYCEASAGADGGVGYSTAAGQKGHSNIGRSAAAWLGARNLGFSRLPWFAKLEGYVRAQVADVLGGHASLMQHVLLSGLAAEACGGEQRAAWWARSRRDLVLARAPDGSLQPRPWHESLSMKSNTDVSVGQVWTTACWAMVLGADPAQSRGAGLPLLLGRKTP